MKALYVEAEDALHLRFSDGKIVESEEIKPGIVLDFDEAGRIIGIEFLDATEHLAEGVDLKTIAA